MTVTRIRLLAGAGLVRVLACGQGCAGDEIREVRRDLVSGSYTSCYVSRSQHDPSLFSGGEGTFTGEPGQEEDYRYADDPNTIVPVYLVLQNKP